MMTEVRDVRQNPGEYFRRWFSDDSFDLFVWYMPGQTIHGFELSYSNDSGEKAIRLFADKGFSHYAVDSGDQHSSSFSSPILRAVPTDKSEMACLLSAYQASNQALPLDLATLVQNKLREYSQQDS